jgi:hypothetical protein
MVRPADFGPIYAETDMSRFPVEPWNTCSNIVFLLILVLFVRLTRLDVRKHPLLVMSLPVLLVGFIGGTVFHATRSHNVWLFMDFVPIFVLTIAAAVHFWYELFGRMWIASLITPVPVFAFHAFRDFLALPRQIHISLGYLGLALGILLPATLFSFKNSGRHSLLLVSALLSFILAISFRLSDRLMLLPMGTHFLWHIFGGVASLCMMYFIYLCDIDKGRGPENSTQ